MKKVLIISFYFSDSENIGSQRSRGLAKYLGEYGWEPIILTQQTSAPFLGTQYKLVEVPFQSQLVRWKKNLGWTAESTVREQKGIPALKRNRSVFEKALDDICNIVIYPDEASSWMGDAIDMIEQIILKEKIDAIISTSGPSSSHIVASKIKRKYNIPWIADFRDMWSQNPYSTSLLRKLQDIAVEKIVISNADVLTTVSEPLADQLRRFHRDIKVISILNGYDPDDESPGSAVSEKFRIIHTGSLYRGKRDPEPLLIAIKELLSEGILLREDVQVDFYGPAEEWLIEDIVKHGLGDLATVHGWISRKEAIEKQRSAQALLLLTWNSPEEYGVYTGKLFEYAAAKRPVILLGFTDGVAADLINETKMGRTASTVSEVKDIVLEYYKEYTYDGKVAFRGSASGISSLSQKRMAKQFSRALDILSSSRPHQLG